MKTAAFENGFKSGQVETETFENGDVTSVTFHRFQSKSKHLSKMADGLVMLTHAQSQVSVVSSFLSVLVRTTIGEKCVLKRKRISVDGALARKKCCCETVGLALKKDLRIRTY